MSSPISQYGLIGYPLGHSFSRSFFTEMFARLHINAEYINLPTPDITRLPDIIAEHPALRGFNVTIPHKQTIIPFLTALNPNAAHIGAVNTVKIIPGDAPDKAPTLIGFNTDVIGFTRSLQPHIKPHHRHALVLGSGGAAHAIVAGLDRLGIDSLTVSRRSRQPGFINYADITPEIISHHKVIVNTTPLGMYPDVNNCPPLPYQAITADHLCFDAVYNPDPTLFLRRCAAQGATTVSGIEMLHLQALAAWEIWNEPPDGR